VKQSFPSHSVPLSNHVQAGEVPGEDAGDWVGAGEDEVREPNGKEQNGCKDRERDRDRHNPDRNFT